MTLEEAVRIVVKEYHEDKWIDEISRRVPNESAGAIQEYITIYFGGDVIAIDH